jgi:RHS repeat-associated protein
MRRKRRAEVTGFTGKERDGETGLDYFGARYMASAQGRFTSPDPLYIEAKRLLDPQALNLYAYARNNPLKFVDPDGMDFVLNCNGSQENCQQTVNDINNRKGAQFKVELGKNNKLQVVKGSVAKNLAANEKALIGAVNDTSTTATINVLGKDSSFNFEKYDQNGQNSIDRSDLNVLGGANSALPGEVIAHAMMESYSSAQNQSGYERAHQFANRFFGQILIDTDNVYPIPRGGPMVTGLDTAYRFGRNGMDVSVIRTLDTPIPLTTLRQRRTPPPGQVTSVTPIR